MKKMNKSELMLTKSLRKVLPILTTAQKPQFLWFMLFTALIAYLLPWVVNPGTALTLNAYDLAEWVSLTPAAHATTPWLLVTLLLRLPLVCTALMILSYTQTKSLKGAILAVCFAFTLLPPLEFITQATNDPNYRQQFALAIIILLSGLAIRCGVLRRFHRLLKTGLPLAGCLSGVWGLSQAYTIMYQYNISVSLGVGNFLSLLAYLFLVLHATVSGLKTR